MFCPVSLDQLKNLLRDVVREEIKSDTQNSLSEKLLSPAEVCKMFQPAISKPTLSKWTDAGHLIMYRIGGRTYYKYSEVMEAAKTLKKYLRP